MDAMTGKMNPVKFFNLVQDNLGIELVTIKVLHSSELGFFPQDAINNITFIFGMLESMDSILRPVEPSTGLYYINLPSPN